MRKLLLPATVVLACLTCHGSHAEAAVVEETTTLFHQMTSDLVEQAREVVEVHAFEIGDHLTETYFIEAH